MIAPDQQFQQRPGETPAQAFQLAPALVTVEHRINRIQRPALVQHDAVLEQARPMNTMPALCRYRSSARVELTCPASSHSRRKCAWVIVRYRRCSRRHHGVGVAHRLQCALHPHPADADLRGALTVAQPGHRLVQRRVRPARLRSFSAL